MASVKNGCRNCTSVRISNSFRIQFEEFMFYTNSQGKYFFKKGLNIKLIGNIRIFNGNFIYINFCHVHVFTNKIYIHTLLKSIIPGPEADAPVKTLINVIFKIIPEIVTQHCINRNNIVSLKKAFSGKVYQRAAFIEIVIMKRHAKEHFVRIFFKVQNKYITLVER